MHGFISRVHSTLGTAAFLALAVGCSHEPKKPAQQASPTFESKVGEQGQQKGMGTMGTMGAPAPQPPAAAQPTSPPEMGAAPPPAPAPTMEQPAAPATEPPATEPAPVVSEVELCDALSRDAKMSITDIQGGEAIVLMPRAGTSLDTVKGAATQLEQAVATVNPHLGASSEPCALFDIGRQGGKVVAVVKEKAVKIQVTSPDPAQVKAIRSQVRDFVKAQMAKSGKEQQHKGGAGTAPPKHHPTP